MTDKIIIDGVDVSECKHLKYDDIKKPICKSGGCTGVYKSCLCENNLDCYYKQLQKTRNAYFRLNNLYNNNCEIIGKLEDILQDIKTLVTTDYIQIKKQLVQNYDCLDNFMQKIEDKCGEVL